MPSAPELLGQRLIAATRLARYEAAVERALLTAVRNQQARALQLLRVVRADAMPADLFDEASWTDELERTVRPTVEGVFAEISTNAERLVPAGARVAAVDLTAQLDRLLGRMRGLSADMSRRLGRTLTQGVNRGESISKLTVRVRAAFDVGESRAREIARSETHTAVEAASHEAALALHAEGVALEKQWLSARDRRVRPTHDPHGGADGQVVAIDQPFVVGGELLMHPGDPAGSAAQTANCRCTALIGEAGTLSR